MNQILMNLKGINGQLELYENMIIIKRKGALSKMTQGFFKGDKTMYLKQISGIQLKHGTIITNGYIQFTLSGGNESTKGILDATKDENTVMFRKKENDTADKIKSKIEELQASINLPQAINPISVADEIKKMKELLDQGIIEQDEFEAKKKQLLDID